MEYEVTIDGVGRLVIPKPIRDRLGLSAGTRLHITETEGRVVLSSERPEHGLIEREGFLVLDVGDAPIMVSHLDTREARQRKLVEFALRRSSG